MEFYRRHASILRVLAHPARLKILDLLADRELTLSQVQEWVETDSASLARHISLLRQAGLVKEKRVGRMLYFRAELQFVESLLNLFELVEPQHRKERGLVDWPVEPR